jgi:hypothetical protein
MCVLSAFFVAKKNSRNEVKQDCKRWKKSRSLKKDFNSLEFVSCSSFSALNFLFLSGF